MKAPVKPMGTTRLPKDAICKSDPYDVQLRKLRKRQKALMDELHYLFAVNQKLIAQLEQAGLTPNL